MHACCQVEYSEDPGTLFYFRYPVAGAAEGEHLPVATTRPETILGDTAVAVHPQVQNSQDFMHAGTRLACAFSGRCSCMPSLSSLLRACTGARASESARMHPSGLAPSVH